MKIQTAFGNILNSIFEHVPPYQKDPQNKRSRSKGRHLTGLILTVMVLFFISSCCGVDSRNRSSSDSTGKEGDSSNSLKAGELIVDRGVIQYIDLEGGFFGIYADSGKRYIPVNLPKSFRSSGSRVEFEAKKAKDEFSTKMWGTNIEITRIMTGR